MSISPSLLSACRNRDVQGNFIAPSFKVYLNPLINITNLAGSLDNPTVSIVKSDSDFSVSGSYVNLTTSEEDGVYTHSLVFTIYSVSNEVSTNLTSIVNLLQDEIYQFRTPCFVYTDKSGDHLISPESFNLTYSRNQSSEGQSIEVTLKAVSSYPAIEVIPLVIPKTYLHITGHLNPSLVTNNGGITVNSVPYYYKDLELDANNAFDIAIEEPVTMETFSAEWAYLADSPLLNIDLSDFDGKESLTDLSYAFKGNTNLQYVTLPSCGSVTTYEECFRDCSDLLSVDGVPSYNGVTSFKRCFQNCTSLQEFSFGSWNIQSEPDCSYMFAGCSSLTTVDHSKLVTISKIDSMFASCTALETMNLYSKVWYVISATDTFYGCTHLSTLSLWGMDPQRVTPGQYASNGFFPLGQAGGTVLTVDFNPSHAHGYNVTKLNNNSLSNYLNVLAHVPATLAGSSNDLTITAAQGDYIDANYPTLLNDVRDQGWLVYYTN